MKIPRLTQMMSLKWYHKLFIIPGQFIDKRCAKVIKEGQGLQKEILAFSLCGISSFLSLTTIILIFNHTLSDNAIKFSFSINVAMLLVALFYDCVEFIDQEKDNINDKDSDSKLMADHYLKNELLFTREAKEKENNF